MVPSRIRDLPEEAYGVIRTRARARGESIQGYMHDRVVADAESPTVDDIWDIIDQLREHNTGTGATTEQIVDDVRAVRGD